MKLHLHTSKVINCYCKYISVVVVIVVVIACCLLHFSFVTLTLKRSHFFLCEYYNRIPMHIFLIYFFLLSKTFPVVYFVRISLKCFAVRLDSSTNTIRILKFTLVNAVELGV